MKNKTIAVCAVFILLSGCSGEDSSATSKTEAGVQSKTDTATEHNALSGYKSALDTAKSITSMAEESEQKKNQAIQDLD